MLNEKLINACFHSNHPILITKNIFHPIDHRHDVSSIGDGFTAVRALRFHKHLQRTIGTISIISTAIIVWMEYQVPQFIEVEDKIVGPLTFKQFIYIAGAGGLCVVFFVYLPIWFAFLMSAPVVGLAAALAFYKVNGKSFIEMLEAGFNYYTGAKFFLWKHKDMSAKDQNTAAAAATATESVKSVRGTPKLTSGKLSELAWSLDIQRPNPNGLEPKA